MKADTVTKDFLSDAQVFADIFNYYIYGGEQVILPEHLQERDPTEIALPYGADGAAVPVQKFRDVQKLCTAKTDGRLQYFLYGAESQAEIHYAAAVKNNLYDALEYAGQVEEAARSHRRAQKAEKGQRKHTAPDSGEFLSGFWKEDRLIPSVTIMIYFGSKEWEAPLSLFDMMDIKDPRVLSCMDNYHVRLIAPVQMEDQEILKFQTGLREVLLFIKYSKNKEALAAVMESNKDRFSALERRAADVIEAITHISLNYKESGGKVDMCQAIQEMRTEERNIGRQEGIQEGRQEGRKEEAQKTAKNLYEMGIEVSKIAKGVDYALETVEQWLGLKE